MCILLTTMMCFQVLSLVHPVWCNNYNNDVVVYTSVISTLVFVNNTEKLLGNDVSSVIHYLLSV